MISISHNYQTEAEWRAHYAAVRKRLLGVPEQRPVVIVEPKPPAPAPVDRPPPKRDRLVVRSPSYPVKSVKEIKRRIAETHGVSVEEMDGPRRSKKLVAARIEAIVAVYKARPDWSTTMIGREFKRDHTTIIHHLRKAGL